MFPRSARAVVLNAAIGGRRFLTRLYREFAELIGAIPDALDAASRISSKNLPIAWNRLRAAFAARAELFFGGFLATIAAMIAIVAMQLAFPTLTLQDVRLRGIDVDGRFPHSPVFAIRHFHDIPDAPLRDVDISFEFTLIDAGRIYDLFQTSTRDNGIRLEFTPPSTLALVVATDVPPKYAVYVIPGSLTDQPWHAFSLTITPDRHIEAVIDNVRAVDTVERNLSFRTDDVALGTGYDAVRNDPAAIRNGSVSIHLAEPNPFTTSPVWKVVLALLLAYNVIFIFLMSDRVREERRSSERS